jgi:hypothetical protein
MSTKIKVLTELASAGYDVSKARTIIIEVKYYNDKNECLFTYVNSKFDRTRKIDVICITKATYDIETGENILGEQAKNMEMVCELARDGWTDTAKYAALIAANCLRKDKPLPPAIKDYLIEALQSVARGKDARKAFHTIRKQGIKTPQPFSYAIMGAIMMESMLAEGVIENFHQASLKAADMLRENGTEVDDSTIRKAYRKRHPNRCPAKE